MKNWFALIMTLTAVCLVFIIVLFVGCTTREQLVELVAGSTTLAPSDTTTSTTIAGASTTTVAAADSTTTSTSTTTTTTTSTTTTTLFSAQGVLDTSFGGDGVVTYPNASAASVVEGVAGTIFVAGSTIVGATDYNLAIWAFDQNGAPMLGFADSGLFSRNYGTGSKSYDLGRGLALDNSGRVIVCGSYNAAAGAGTNYNTLLIRLNGTTGAFDDAFGLVSSDLGLDSWEDVVVDASGKIIVGGYGNGEIIVARYLENGSFDSAFSAAPVSYVSAAGNDDAWSVAAAPDGKIILGGTLYSAGTNKDFVVLRYNTDGTLDSSFGSAGLFTYDRGNGTANKREFGRSIAIDHAGRILFTGSTEDTDADNDLLLGRLTASGALDPTFNGTGLLIYPEAAEATNDQGVAVAEDKTGKIVVAGTANGKVIVRRYNADGLLDASFADSGMYTYPVNSTCMDMKIDRSGKILVTGYAGSDMFLLRLK